MASSSVSLPRTLPLIVVSDDVLLPGASIRVPITTPTNLAMIRQHLLKNNSLSNAFIGVVPKHEDDHEMDNEGKDSSAAADIKHPIGTAALVVQISGTNWPQPSYTLLLTGACRFRLEKIEQHQPYPIGLVKQLDRMATNDSVIQSENPELSELISALKNKATYLLDLLDISSPATARLKRILGSVSDHSLADVCASVVKSSRAEKLEVLRAVDLVERFQKSLALINRQIEGLSPVRRTRRFNGFVDPLVVRTSHRRLPNAELNGEGDMDADDLLELEDKLKAANLPDHAQKVATKEFRRLKKMMPHLPEHSLTRTYLELMSELPWSKSSEQTLNINKARADLDADHYAMEKVKKRVLEYLAVRQLRNSLRGPILCLVGPPGVGKTSIGRSIANTLSRQFHRISLGGVCDQSDVRGHRRTYIGAFPGRIIQGLRTVGVNNPVFLLDEIDKLSAGVHGDPAAALLEVLDPEQNCTFTDHYLNIAFDLSQVLFIATANSVRNIPPALLDRMEVIPVSGYTEEEKLHIALKHLIPKQLNENGLSEKILTIPEESLKIIISRYTREAGVRSLERKIGALCRAVAVLVAEGRSPEVTGKEHAESGATVSVTSSERTDIPIVLDEMAVEDILGLPPFDHEVSGQTEQPGVAVGLAWTQFGGDIMYVEASKVDGGSGRLVLTGQLGSVMRESAKLALNWVRAHLDDYGIAIGKSGDLLENTDIHIHFPAGAQGKDGPSAGVTIVSVLVSLLTGRCVSHGVAMTGEVTLRGLVLPVGGIKEKILAAHRAGITKVILPYRNQKDVNEVPDSVQRDLTFIYVRYIDDVLQAAFDGGFPEARINVDNIIPSNL